MPKFPEEVIRQTWYQADGKCEKCKKHLLLASRGTEGKYGWEAHHRISLASYGSNTMSNCEILCQECHKNTRTYGG